MRSQINHGVSEIQILIKRMKFHTLSEVLKTQTVVLVLFSKITKDLAKISIKITITMARALKIPDNHFFN